ncbi:MAG: phospholipase D-like domain-containing protein [Elusimicrobiota bacterium]
MILQEKGISGKTGKLIKTSLICLCLFFLSPAGAFSSISAEITDISNRKYYPAVKESIDNAQSSIHMAMFVVSLHDRPSRVYSLLNSLVKAADRGVEVMVILDKNINFLTGEIEDKNQEAYNYLQEKGVDVFFDDVYMYTHKKTLVIDGETVITGSTNWSQTALARSKENALLIKSPELAKRLRDGILQIKLYDPEPRRAIDMEKALPLSNEFMGNIAGSMQTNADERAFDLYLLLLYNAKKDNVIDFNFDKYASLLGISETPPVAYRRQIIKTLRKLKDRYNLIEVQFRHGRNALVTLSDITDSREKYKYPSENYFLLPSEYFEYNWDRILSLRAKYSYLINRYMYHQLNNRFWSLSLEKLSEKLGTCKSTISHGMIELRKHNIIDIVYSDVEEIYEHRNPSRYELLGLYSPSEHKKALLKLSRQYGQESFDKARKLAETVYKQNDIEAIEKLIILGKEYGENRLQKAHEILSKKIMSNPKKTLRYAIGIIKSLRDEELEDMDE